MSFRIFTALTAAAASVLSLGAVTSDEVLAKMDSASPKFSSMTASINRVTYTRVLDEKQVESGTIRLRKSGKELQVFMEIMKPDPKLMAFRGRTAEIYLPRLHTVQVYDLGKQGQLVDQFLLVGFGAAGRDLRANYDIKLLGEETVAGQKAFKLQLTPRNVKLKEKLQNVVLWIDDSGTYPVQQQFLEPSGDYYLFTYSDIKLNPGLTEDSLKLKVPKGTKREVLNK
ncbi:MAG: outer membrane lipoprotein-sorting protein [Bryobacteraceae bacterium]|nr:outer membrane lipoprotein-sorting protein [Bryobacteraceae bacterium]